METHTHLVKHFFATLLFSILVLGCPNSPSTGSYEDGVQAFEAGDYKKAFEILKPLAEQGDPSAQYNLGVSYENGHGVRQDYTEAGKWYKKAAEQGHAKAQLNLGVMYFNSHGVRQDYIEAHKWYNLAESRLPLGDDQETARKNRDNTEKRMTSAQIAKAQKLARKWKPKPNKSP